MVDSIKVISGWITAKSVRLHVGLVIGLLLLDAAITLQSGHFWMVAPRAALLYVLIISAIYIGRWLVQKFMVKGQWWPLLLFSLLSIVFLSTAGAFGMGYLLNLLDGADFTTIVITIPLLVTIAVLTGGVISLIRVLFKQQQAEAQALQYQKDAEIRQLTEKLSPHFLFNVLHTLYGLSINAPQQVPDLLLQLSGLLRYNVYSSNLPLVLLDEEIAHLNNYIALQRVRMHDRLALKMDVSNSNHQIKIAPLLLMTFVENAFKHARQSLSDTIKIDIELQTNAQNIYFRINNSKAEYTKQQQQHSDAKSGFGLPATIQRLNLLYPDAYTLSYGEKDNNFEVNLILSNRFE